MLDCPVRGIDHGGKRLRIQTNKGAISADQAIVTVPSAIVAAERIQFTPALPDKVEAANGLPLGLTTSSSCRWTAPKNFRRAPGCSRTRIVPATAGYHIRPFGWPMIEAYFGRRMRGRARKRRRSCFFRFRRCRARRRDGMRVCQTPKTDPRHCWGIDPFALGAYSFALPGYADRRALLAEPVDDRLFFAGEACSLHDFSTAHGGYLHRRCGGGKRHRRARQAAAYSKYFSIILRYTAVSAARSATGTHSSTACMVRPTRPNSSTGQ